MLIRVLQQIADNEIHSYNTLAKTLNLEPEMVKQMFYNLQRMGYIISADPACGDDKCEECGVCCTKKKKEKKDDKPVTAVTRWKLTPKGEEAVRAK